MDVPKLGSTARSGRLDRPAPTAPLPKAPSMSGDLRVAGGGAAAGARFDVGDAAERLIAAAGGDLEAAYMRSITMRNMKPTEPGHQKALVELSRDAGLTRPIGADELRDVEHFLFAAAYTAGIAPSAPDDGYWTQVGKTLMREVTFASAFFSTLGYSGAKVANEISKAAFDQPLLKSRTKPSFDELIAGIRGAARGLRD